MLKDELQTMVNEIAEPDYRCENTRLGDNNQIILGGRTPAPPECESENCNVLRKKIGVSGGMFKYYDMINWVAGLDGVSTVVDVGIYKGASLFAALHDNKNIKYYLGIDVFVSTKSKSTGNNRYSFDADCLEKLQQDIEDFKKKPDLKPKNPDLTIEIQTFSQEKPENYANISDIDFVVYDGSDDDEDMVKNTFLNIEKKFNKDKEFIIVLIKKYGFKGRDKSCIKPVFDKLYGGAQSLWNVQPFLPKEEDITLADYTGFNLTGVCLNDKGTSPINVGLFLLIRK